MKRKLAMTLLLALAACGPRVGDTGPVEPRRDTSTRPGSGGSAGPAEPSPHAGGAVAPADNTTLVAANNAFATDLYAQVRQQPGNLAFSPASISVALGMTWGGARGQTAQQMAQVMHFADVDGDVHAGFAALERRFNDPARTDYELRMANRLFGEQSATFHAPFLALTRDSYGAELEPVDFIGNADASRVRINTWVAEQTNQRIRDLLPPGSIDDMARLVLTNAIYFKGKWKREFDPEATFSAAFSIGGGRSVDVPTMHQTAVFGLASVDGVSVLRMPYTGDELAMYIILPSARDGLADIEQRMDAATLQRWLEAPQSTEVEVALPRFKVDPPQPLVLSQTLRDMGMTDAFDPGSADFSAMADIRPLFIQDVFHKAFVEVNEEGTEAAAATAVVMATETAVALPPPSFHADHPFLFVLRDLRTGSVLFLGRVVDPR